MDSMSLWHQAVLFTHVMAFAVTLSAVLREDLRLLATRRVEPMRLRQTMRVVSAGLAVLWATGLALVAVSAAASPMPWAPNAKLCAKLVVVTLLTLNGCALHVCVFPRLQAGTFSWTAGLRLPAALGAISSASWVYAAFVGVARPLSPAMPFAGFMALYAAALAMALFLARVLLGTAPAMHQRSRRLQRRLHTVTPRRGASAGECR
ncbi:hypothetical protein [Aquincola tertiaricarbonis]|uniref:hypothetical protein n=1 Tax=Aquincola tertiaricarbonis TaxID=391953 RepID=UPI0006985205|nr:hypothetical protein [Aquincola tertiaricarbonis]